MCGRFALTRPPAEVRALFGYPESPNFPPRYNVAPTQPVAVVTADRTSRHFVLMRWGFLPAFVKDPKDYPLVVNVRAETAREKPSFRAAFQRRRCLLPADGFYEWQAVGKTKRPFLIRRPDRTPFAFAGLWETWSSADGSEIDTVAILTTEANATLSALHGRCPAIIGPGDMATWLDPDTPPDAAAALLHPPAEDALDLVPVSTRVNAVANDDADVQTPVTGVPQAAQTGGASAQGRLF